MTTSNSTPLPAEPLSVVRDAGRLASALAPIRRRLLEGLAEPDSATGLSRRLGLSRQKVNYHLRELERLGFVELAETRRRRGCIERVMRVAARAFVIDPGLLGRAPTDDRTGDRFSSAWLIGAASSVIHDVALLRERAKAAGKPLVTLTMQADIAFASPGQLRAFSDELSGAVAALAAKYGAGNDGRSRSYRLTTGLHPVVTKSASEARAESAGADATVKEEERHD